MPAALPAATPVGASSKTRQHSGGTGGENAAAAARKMSGSGLPRATWSPVDHESVELVLCFDVIY